MHAHTQTCLRSRARSPLLCLCVRARVCVHVRGWVGVCMHAMHTQPCTRYVSDSVDLSMQFSLSLPLTHSFPFMCHIVTAVV